MLNSSVHVDIKQSQDHYHKNSLTATFLSLNYSTVSMKTSWSFLSLSLQLYTQITTKFHDHFLSNAPSSSCIIVEKVRNTPGQIFKLNLSGWFIYLISSFSMIMIYLYRKTGVHNIINWSLIHTDIEIHMVSFFGGVAKKFRRERVKLIRRYT